MPESNRFILWVWSEKFARHFPDAPFMAAAGSQRFCRAHQRQFKADYADALCGIYESGDEPKGLVLQVRRRTGR